MADHLPDFDDATCWVTGDHPRPPAVGDLYNGVPLPALEDPAGLVTTGSWDRERLHFQAERRLALVVSVVAQVLVVPVFTANDTDSYAEFCDVRELGRHAVTYCRLPGHPAFFDEDALAMLSQPMQLPGQFFEDAPVVRLMSMKPVAQGILKARFMALAGA